jgi:ZIP family zinc transporter
LLLESFNGIYLSFLAGLVIAIAFPIGALIAIFVNYPSRTEADIVAFGAGIFFAAIAFSLVDESVKEGNVSTMIIGFVVGAVTFSILNHYLKRLKTDQYKRLGENETNGASAKMAVVGLLLDSIPEAIFVGILIAIGHGGVAGAVSALFLGNLATTMEGAKRMSQSGISVSRIMFRWSFVLLVVALSAPLGFYLVKLVTKDEISIILGFAAGILIAFIAEDLLPEAYKKANFHIGLSTTFGFLLGYILFHFL